MGSLTFSELLTIAVIVLIVFGPQRLPELARRAGQMLTRVRQATREIRDELQTEYREAIAPLEEMKEDLKAARADLTAARDELVAAASEVSKDIQEATKPDASLGKSETQPAAPTVAPQSDGALQPLASLREELKAAARDEVPEEEPAAPSEQGEEATDLSDGPEEPDQPRTETSQAPTPSEVPLPPLDGLRDELRAVAREESEARSEPIDAQAEEADA